MAYARYPSPGRLWRVVLALLYKGDALRELAENDQAVSAYDEVVRLANNSRNPRVIEVSCGALVEKAKVLRRLGKMDDAVKATENIITRFGDSESPAIQNRVALAMVIKADILEADGKIENANAARDALIEKFLATSNEGVEPWLAWAMYDKAKGLWQLGRADESLEQIRLAESRFASANLGRSLYPLAAALSLRGRVLDGIGDRQGALDSYRDVVKRFESYPPVRFVVASAAEAEADLLAPAQAAEALALYRGILVRFRDSTDESIQSLVKRVSEKIERPQQSKADSSGSLSDEIRDASG